MHKPLSSVAGFAQFSLNSEQVTLLQQRLDRTQDWQEWLHQIELHGLSGMATAHSAAYGLRLPNPIRLQLKALNMRHRAAASARFKALSELATCFASHHIHWLALKGVALMPLIYEAPEHRPMRDIDLLLPADQVDQAAQYLRQLGYTLPTQQPSKYMRDSHQLPNATKTIDGFKVSVELHRDAIASDVPGHLCFPTNKAEIESVTWNGLNIPRLANHLMAAQVSRHFSGLHDQAVLKLINAMDVVGLATQIAEQGDFAKLQREQPSVINTLRCLHLLNPLPTVLQAELPDLSNTPIEGAGQTMIPLSQTLLAPLGLKQRLRQLFKPPTWWLHLHYGVNPSASLIWVHWIKHPFTVATWLVRRAKSWILGG